MTFSKKAILVLLALMSVLLVTVGTLLAAGRALEHARPTLGDLALWPFTACTLFGGLAASLAGIAWQFHAESNPAKAGSDPWPRGIILGLVSGCVAGITAAALARLMAPGTVSSCAFMLAPSPPGAWSEAKRCWAACRCARAGHGPSGGWLERHASRPRFPLQPRPESLAPMSRPGSSCM